MEPITQFFSDPQSFDLDADGGVSERERTIFDALDPVRDGVLTEQDAEQVRANFDPLRQHAVDQLLAASSLYERRSNLPPRGPLDVFVRARDLLKARDAAQLAHALTPPGTVRRQLADARLRAIPPPPPLPTQL